MAARLTDEFRDLQSQRAAAERALGQAQRSHQVDRERESSDRIGMDVSALQPLSNLSRQTSGLLASTRAAKGGQAGISSEVEIEEALGHWRVRLASSTRPSNLCQLRLAHSLDPAPTSLLFRPLRRTLTAQQGCSPRGLGRCPPRWRNTRAIRTRLTGRLSSRHPWSGLSVRLIERCDRRQQPSQSHIDAARHIYHCTGTVKTNCRLFFGCLTHLSRPQMLPVLPTTGPGACSSQGRPSRPRCVRVIHSQALHRYDVDFSLACGRLRPSRTPRRRAQQTTGDGRLRLSPQRRLLPERRPSAGWGRYRRLSRAWRLRCSLALRSHCAVLPPLQQKQRSAFTLTHDGCPLRGRWPRARLRSLGCS